MTPSVLGGLAENARRRQPDAWLFDLGKVYRHPAQPTPRDRASETAGTGRYESWELGIALAGSPVAAPPGDEPLVADVATLKGIVDALHDAIGAPRPAYARRAGGRAPSPPASRADGRSSSTPPGVPTARSARCTRASSRPGAWPAARSTRRSTSVGCSGSAADVVRASPIPSAQPVDRDLAVVVDRRDAGRRGAPDRANRGRARDSSRCASSTSTAAGRSARAGSATPSRSASSRSRRGTRTTSIGP